MRKFLIKAIPITALALFILIMQSGYLLKKSFGGNDDICGTINDMINVVNNESWDEASVKLQYLENAWDKVVGRIQFSSERDEINDFKKCIARLKGAVKAKDKLNALMELYEAYNCWDNIGD